LIDHLVVVGVAFPHAELLLRRREVVERDFSDVRVV
jgi:hypothetical protein